MVEKLITPSKYSTNKEEPGVIFMHSLEILFVLEMV